MESTPSDAAPPAAVYREKEQATSRKSGPLKRLLGCAALRQDSHHLPPTCPPWSAVLPCGDSHQTGGDAVPTQSPEQSEILVHRDGAVLTLTFDRPDARNAMTWNMYERLYETAEAVDADDSLRVLVPRGAGGKAFVAGTDISQFTTFRTAEDGLQYERDGERRTARLERVGKPVIAQIEGFAVGGGFAIAAVCDIRIATP